MTGVLHGTPRSPALRPPQDQLRLPFQWDEGGEARPTGPGQGGSVTICIVMRIDQQTARRQREAGARLRVSPEKGPSVCLKKAPRPLVSGRPAQTRHQAVRWRGIGSERQRPGRAPDRYSASFRTPPSAASLIFMIKTACKCSR